MLPVGIDCFSFYAPHYYLDLPQLARSRQIDPAKFCLNLGQAQMAITTPEEDIVTLAANAGEQILQSIDRNEIDWLLIATESATDRSKASGLFIHSLLNLPKRCRILELKQACYSATGGLQLMMSYLQQYPQSKGLLIAVDIARYALGTTAESSQGAGAVAMLLTTHPRTLVIESGAGIHAEDHMDFWRPNYADHAFVDGKLSCELYLKFLQYTWLDYQTQTTRHYADHQHFCYHIPVPKLAEKAHLRLAKLNGISAPPSLTASLQYSKKIGNCYTASLYLSLLSLLEHTTEDLSGQRLGFYSYGSGAVAEFFSGIVTPGYQSASFKELHQQQLQDREALTVEEYEAFYHHPWPSPEGRIELEIHQPGRFRLAAIDVHRRIYEKIALKHSDKKEQTP